MVTRTVQPENICECKSATKTWGHFNEDSVLMKLYYLVTSLTTTSDWCPSESVKYVLGYCCKKKTPMKWNTFWKWPKQKMTLMSVVQYEQKKFWRVTKIAIDIYISLLSKFQDQMTKEKLEKRVFAVTQEAESRTNGKWHFTLPKSIKRWKLATASSRERLFRRTWKTPSYILLAEGEYHMKEHCVIIELTKITYTTTTT